MDRFLDNKVSYIRITRYCVQRSHSQWRHNDIIKWKHFPRYWPFVRGIHGSPGNSPHKGQWRGDLMLSLICALNKRLTKLASGCWLKSPAGPLWRHSNGHEMEMLSALLALCEVRPIVTSGFPHKRGSKILHLWTQFAEIWLSIIIRIFNSQCKSRLRREPIDVYCRNFRENIK